MLARSTGRSGVSGGSGRLGSLAGDADALRVLQDIRTQEIADAEQRRAAMEDEARYGRFYDAPRAPGRSAGRRGGRLARRRGSVETTRRGGVDMVCRIACGCAVFLAAAFFAVAVVFVLALTGYF